MADVSRHGGKKNRKHGGTKKSPAQQRYTAERRWERNAKRRVVRQSRWLALCAKVRELFRRDHSTGKPHDVQRRIRHLQEKP